MKLLLLLALAASAKDLYKNTAQLRAAAKEGDDFRVEWAARGSTVAVLAIHGGEIEPGSSETARAIAGADWSYYIFSALKPKTRRPHELHVTSVHFDDPPAVALATAAVVTVSVHGAKDADEKICVGGSSAARRASVGLALSRAGFFVEEPCKRLPGTKPRNISNRAKEGGVQLEISKGLRAKLKADADLRDLFSRAVREGLTK